MAAIASRRSVLRGLTIGPAAMSAIATPFGPALAALHRNYEDRPIKLARTKEGRNISRFRYQNADRACQLMEQPFFLDGGYTSETLHQAGFVAQQALCSYLLDVGFADEWNAQHIKQNITKALDYANATGLAHDCPEMARLAVILSPYWKWRHHYDVWDEDRPDTDGFQPPVIATLARSLVERVRDVTGHPRPKGWHRYPHATWS